jgi:transcription elongation factor Elf1
MAVAKTRSAFSIPQEHIARLSELVKEYRCPDCKAWALYVKVTKRGPTVLCRKCAFNMSLEQFAQKYMDYVERDGVMSIRVVDLFGDEKIIVV